MSTANDAAAQFAPRPGTDYPFSAQRLADAAGLATTNATPLLAGSFATLQVGAQAIRVTFFGAATGGSVAATDMLLAANTSISFIVQNNTTHVYAAEPGGATYEAWVWTSSPGFRSAT